MSRGSPSDAEGWSNDAATPTIGSVTGNGLDGSGVLNETCRTVEVLIMLWICSRSYVAIDKRTECVSFGSSLSVSNIEEGQRAQEVGNLAPGEMPMLENGEEP